jgi:Emfourin
MRVRFRQTGGFGGLVLGCDLDTNTLPKADAVALTRLVRQGKLQEVQGKQNKQARDLQCYEIVVEENGVTTKAAFDDMSIKSHAEPLLRFLTKRARAVPLDK